MARSMLDVTAISEVASEVGPKHGASAEQAGDSGTRSASVDGNLAGAVEVPADGRDLSETCFARVRNWKGRVAKSILDPHPESERDFEVLRKYWLDSIIFNRPVLTEGQIKYMKLTNQNLNVALRLVHSFTKEDEIWDVPYSEQKAVFGAQYCRLKPLIDFFQ